MGHYETVISIYARDYILSLLAPSDILSLLPLVVHLVQIHNKLLHYMIYQDLRATENYSQYLTSLFPDKYVHHLIVSLSKIIVLRNTLRRQDIYF